MNYINPNIVYLDWKSKEHLNAVSNLHIKLLPESILSKLGYNFLFKFYYSKLCKEKLIEVYLYKFHDEYVGFISCTNKPFTFIKEGNKKYFFSILFLLLKSFLSKPSRILTFLQQNNNDSINEIKQHNENEIGQFLSFGVLENFRKIIDKEENETIPNVLMNQVFLHFKKNNKKIFFLQVLKSNIVALRFYNKYNCKIITRDNSESDIVMFDLKYKNGK